MRSNGEKLRLVFPGPAAIGTAIRLPVVSASTTAGRAEARKRMACEKCMMDRLMKVMVMNMVEVNVNE